MITISNDAFKHAKFDNFAVLSVNEVYPPRSAIISQHECEIDLPTLSSVDQERRLQLPAGTSYALEAVTGSLSS
jgi:hypothetical protein